MDHPVDLLNVKEIVSSNYWLLTNYNNYITTFELYVAVTNYKRDSTQEEHLGVEGFYDWLKAQPFIVIGWDL